jgi:pSer/pThr/pTyr-binding forkhead associated (FHA) protein
MKNDTVSGHHAEIVKKGSQFIIADLESSNSVLVGGKRIEKAALQDGDIVELGEVRLRFIEQSSNSLH